MTNDHVHCALYNKPEIRGTVEIPVQRVCMRRTF